MHTDFCVFIWLSIRFAEVPRDGPSCLEIRPDGATEAPLHGGPFHSLEVNLLETTHGLSVHTSLLPHTSTPLVRTQRKGMEIPEKVTVSKSTWGEKYEPYLSTSYISKQCL